MLKALGDVIPTWDTISSPYFCKGMTCYRGNTLLRRPWTIISFKRPLASVILEWMDYKSNSFDTAKSGKIKAIIFKFFNQHRYLMFWLLNWRVINWEYNFINMNVYDNVSPSTFVFVLMMNSKCFCLFLKFF